MTNEQEREEKEKKEDEMIEKAAPEAETGEVSNEQTRTDKVEVVQSSEVLFAEQQVIIQSLKQELDKYKKKNSELETSFIRLAADFENFKKRAEKERQMIIRTANESLIKKLLDVYESLEKALCSVKDTPDNNFVEGIKLIHKEFSRILKSEGIEPIPSVGKPLDVYKHEVLMRKINDDVPEDTVLEEIQRGYILNTLVLRPAKVIVSQKSPQGEVQDQNKEKPGEEKGG